MVIGLYVLWVRYSYWPTVPAQCTISAACSDLGIWSLALGDLVAQNYFDQL